MKQRILGILALFSAVIVFGCGNIYDLGSLGDVSAVLSIEAAAQDFSTTLSIDSSDVIFASSGIVGGPFSPFSQAVSCATQSSGS